VRRTTQSDPLGIASRLPEFRSSAFQRVRAQIERLARNPTVPILLEGEAGTGKTLIARWIHEVSPRAGGNFCAVLLAGLDDALAGSELFGHVAGAFTDARASRTGQFASASGGTLLLDEIGKASRLVQQKLLYAVEHREIRPIGSDRSMHVDTRIVAATNVPLRQLVDEGTFLPDLNARLDVFRVTLPPLRERRADIPTLVMDSLEHHAGECGYVSVPTVDAELMHALQRAPWPNNLRELDSAMRRLLIEAELAPVLTLAHCPDALSHLRSAESPPLTRELVLEAISKHGGVSAAARALNVDRTTIHRRLRAMDADPGR
jgi:DNA-binding NtrC family response regulator